MRRLAIPLSTTLLVVLLSGCSAVQTTSRSTPDRVELDALAEAQRPAMRDGIPIASDVWTQLWTPTQAASQIQACVSRGSGGVHPMDRRLWLVPAGERGALYSYDATVLRRCLVAHGQQVPRMPSRFRFEYLMRASASWNAYDLVIVTSRTAWYALADACPALPPGVSVD